MWIQLHGSGAAALWRSIRGVDRRERWRQHPDAMSCAFQSQCLLAEEGAAQWVFGGRIPRRDEENVHRRHGVVTTAEGILLTSQSLPTTTRISVVYEYIPRLGTTLVPGASAPAT